MIEIQEYNSKEEVLNYLPKMIQDVFDIDESKAKRQLKAIVDRFIEDIIAIVEYPYIDKYYRDTYYNFFSKKHISHQRDSIRVSFFSNSVNLDNFVDEEKIQEVQDAFLGFITIRPTSVRIIGHSFISPKILVEKDFVCCLCKERVSIGGVELSVYGFPFCSQDNEFITCAECALLVVTDYFSNKFSDYQRPLPSKINEILKIRSYERQLPSTGLTDNDIAFVLKELGFGSKIYTKGSSSAEKKLFKRLLYIYIESGIPVILTLENKEHAGHAVIAIGRESVKNKKMPKKNFIENKANFSDLFDKILLMNDNCTPYELVDYEKPVLSDLSYTISSFIVPLHNKLHSDASLFLNHFDAIIEEFSKKDSTRTILSRVGEKYMVRYFLTTSRSYKNYILKSKGLSLDFKTVFNDQSMPKFIWVAEIIYGNAIVSQNQIVNTVVILDATESSLSGNLIIAFNAHNIIWKNLHVERNNFYASNERYSVTEINIGDLYTFDNNLKGSHTTWYS